MSYRILIATLHGRYHRHQLGGIGHLERWSYLPPNMQLEVTELGFKHRFAGTKALFLKTQLTCFLEGWARKGRLLP